MDAINSMYANGMNVNSSANKLEDKLNNSNLQTATDDELMSVCKDFEKYFVEQMIEAMMKMSDVDGDGGDNIYASLFGLTEDSSSAMSTMSGYFGDNITSSLAEVISESNGGKGLGFAQSIYQQMKRNYNIPEASDNLEADSKVEGVNGDNAG